MDTHSSPSPPDDLRGPTALRLGILGCGRVVERFHVPALRRATAWSVYAACDPNAKRRAWAQTALPGAAVYQTAEQLLSDERLDAALIASPAPTQAALTIACLQRGLHVLVEKPGGLSPDQASSMQRAAEQGNRLLWVGYNRKFKPAYQALRVALREDEIRSIRSRLAYSLRAWDPISGLDPAHLGDGLVLYDVAVHQLDLIPWLTGRPIQAVRGESTTAEAGGRLAEFTLMLDGGAQARCLAAHSEVHQETLEIESGRGSWTAHPSGLLRGRRLGRAWMRTIAASQHWGHRKLMRLGLMADPLASSYLRQLEGFAERIRDPRPRSADDLRWGPVPVHAALEALNRGMRSPEEWIPVKTEGWTFR